MFGGVICWRGLRVARPVAQRAQPGVVFGVVDVGFGVSMLHLEGSGFLVLRSRLEVEGFGPMVKGSGCRSWGSGVRLKDFGFRVPDLKFRVYGLGCMGVWLTRHAASKMRPHAAALRT